MGFVLSSGVDSAKIVCRAILASSFDIPAPSRKSGEISIVTGGVKLKML
jgi:hypothetical protein